MDSKKDSLSAVAPSENWFTGVDPSTSGTAVDRPPAKKQKLSLSSLRNRPLKDRTNQDSKQAFCLTGKDKRVRTGSERSHSPEY